MPKGDKKISSEDYILNGWNVIGEEAHPEDVFLLVLRKSGMQSTPFELISARYDSDSNAWFGVDGNRLTESGYSPSFWTDIPLIPQPKPSSGTNTTTPGTSQDEAWSY